MDTRTNKQNHLSQHKRQFAPGKKRRETTIVHLIIAMMCHMNHIMVGSMEWRM
jgi:hypothetical protein